MIRFPLLALAHVICIASFGQSKYSLELNFIGRQDEHANYVSNFAGRVYNDINRISGFSYGMNGILRREVSKSISVYFGLGYYQLRVDRVRGPIPYGIPGIRTARNINYPDSTALLHGTSKYHYNNLAITIGFDKVFSIGKEFGFDIAPELIGYKIFSQRYQIDGGSHYYTAHNSKPLEVGINIKTGVIKRFKHFYLQPSLVIPVYQNLKGDEVFYEDNDMNISKWFHGIGLSLTVGKHL